MSFLECENLYKKFPDSRDNFDVDISFNIEEKCFVSIVGPSGSGKSTVLKMIAGLESIDKKDSTVNPKIILDGDDITNLPSGKRNLGMVFQNSALFLNMSVLENVAYGLRCHGMKKKEAHEKAESFLERVGLGGFGKRNPETLSGGEAQRCALARTLIVEPKLVLLDEPLSAVDSDLRKKLAADIKKMQRDFGFCAIMVTHDIDEAKTVSDRIIQIKDGRKVWEGSAADF